MVFTRARARPFTGVNTGLNMHRITGEGSGQDVPQGHAVPAHTAPHEGAGYARIGISLSCCGNDRGNAVIGQPSGVIHPPVSLVDRPERPAGSCRLGHRCECLQGHIEHALVSRIPLANGHRPDEARGVSTICGTELHG